ncbi:MAG: minor capsid protein [Brachybacterium sp.]|uniref:minor capsid protein n=1 Tax=Brachybacterium sp. TaxID=1891286 RepID=UPI0026482B3D|nr:minor capsid protein [Brachybacterium sp.]MDN5687008.1 minor capsid protein [Brachybacterium sp.]
MTPPESHDDLIVRGIAEAMHAAGAGTWRPTGTYQEGETAITVGALPASPARAVALTTYGSEDDPVLADSLVMVQATIRGTTDPRTVNATAAALFDLLHGRTGFTLAGVPVILARRVSWARLGRDEGGRWRRSENYYLNTHHPSAHRTF